MESEGSSRYRPVHESVGGSAESSITAQASEVAQSGKQAAADVTRTASGAVQDVAGETASQARQLMNTTSQQLTEQAGVQKDALVGGLRSLVDQLGAMTDDINEEGLAIQLAGRAREQARTAADWLDGRDPGQVLEDVRSFGRRRPAAYAAGALLVGVVAGRLTRGVAAVHTGDDSAPSSDPLRTDDTARHEQTPETRDTAADTTAGRHGYADTIASPGLYSDTALGSRTAPRSTTGRTS